MQHRLPSVMLAGILTIPVAALPQDKPSVSAKNSVPGTQSSKSQSPLAAPTPSPPLTTHHSPSPGQDLVNRAARQLALEPAISAELRYRVDSAGHQLVGSGAYLQLATGEDRLLKLELKMQVGERPASLLEVRGEDFYWVRRDVPPRPPTLGRVNLRQLRSITDPATGVGDINLLPHQGWIVLGGLPRLLAALRDNFSFDTPRADELQFISADGASVQKLPIWTVKGRWKPERLATFTGKAPDAPAATLPDQLPDEVELVLGRTEKILPLFPYRITYWRTSNTKADASASPEPQPHELLTLELFNVYQKGDIDRREFQFDAGEQEVLDLTTAYVQRVGPETIRR